MDQSVVDAAGLNQGPLEREIAGIRARREPLLDEQAKLRQQRGTIGADSEEIIKKQAAETQPAIDAYVSKAKDAPRTELKEERMQDFERPQFDQQELNQTFGALMVASLILGSASRGPYNNVMGAMTGAINGFLKGDHDNVEEQFKVFDKNLVAMKERNTAIRDELQDAEKKWSHDLAALKTAYEMVAAKYDLPLAQQALKDKNLAQAQQEIWREINSLDQAETRLTTTVEQGRNRLATERIHSADRASQRAIAQQAHSDAVAARQDAREAAGWQIFQAPDGTLTRVNARTGESEAVDDSKGLRKPGAAGKGGDSRNVRQQLVESGARNALERMSEISADGNFPNTSPMFGQHGEGAIGRAVHGVGQAMLSKGQQKTDARYASLIDEAIPVFTGGLRGSDAFRRFLLGQVPSPGDDQETANEKMRVFKANIDGTLKTFGGAFSSNPTFKAEGESDAGNNSALSASEQEELENLRAKHGRK